MSTIAKRFLNLFSDNEHYKYRLEGEVVFQFAPTEMRECPSDVKRVLREAILRVDQVFPWKITNGLGEPMSSIQYLGDGQDQFNNWGDGELNVWFRITPFGCYEKSKIHAYERYLEKLAEELSRQALPPGVTSVRSLFRLASAKAFEVG